MEKVSRKRAFLNYIVGREAGVSSQEKDQLESIVYDAHRFLFSHSSIVQDTPLQVYGAALLFSPAASIIRNQYAALIKDRSSCPDATYSRWNSSLRAMHGHSTSVTAVSLSSDGGVVVSGSLDRTTRIWDKTTGTERRVLENSRPVLNLAISPDDKTIATGLDNGCVEMWDMTSGQKEVVIRAHSHHIVALGFSSDSQLLVTADREKIKLWDAVTGSKKRSVESPGRSEIIAAAFSATGIAIVSNNRGKAWVMDVKDEARLWDLSGEPSWVPLDYTRVTAVAISTDGNLIAAARGTSWAQQSSFCGFGTRRHSQSHIRVWDFKSWAGYDVLRTKNTLRHKQPLAFSPNNQSLVCGYPHGTIQLGGRPISVDAAPRKSSADPDRTLFTAAAMSPNCRTIVSGSYTGIVRLWPATRSLDFEGLSSYSQPDKPMAISPCGRLIMMRNSPKSIGLYSTATGERKNGWSWGLDSNYLPQITAATFSGQGSQLAVIRDRRHVQVFGIGVARTASSGGGLHLEAEIRFRRASQLEPSALAFSPGGSRLAVGFADGLIRVFEIRTRRRRGPLVAASASGRRQHPVLIILRRRPTIGDGARESAGARDGLQTQ